ncbi:FBXO43 isoform 2 [Pongo abelii]|uniref:FBXO43 isoform 2 n=1 Tax=Pongo abelii TaxID=9601 RepID=A0A2J8UFE3_PONAB|nr:FBXO43 isoform 2 [Pongo abelii]
MNFKDKDERISCLEAYVTLTSKSSRFTDGKSFHFNK